MEEGIRKIPVRKSVRQDLSKNRPRFGKDSRLQARRVSDMVPGERFINFDKDIGARTLVEIVEEPLKAGKTWMVKVVVIDYEGKRRFEHFISLADFSIVPYENGQWGCGSCLLKTKGETAKILQEINKKNFQPLF